MITINSSDIIKKPSYITQPNHITFYEKLREKIEEICEDLA